MAASTVTSRDLVLCLDPQLGGRVTSLTYRKTELLSGQGVNPANWGATYWTSPQADWGWPPVAAVDSDPYEVLSDVPAGSVAVRSPLAVIGERRFHIEKRFSPGPDGSIDALYRIHNVGETAFRMASWEISRVGPKGLTFFPTGDAALTPITPHGRLEVEQVAGVSFYDHVTYAPGPSIKLHADGKEGWLAHVAGDLLIVKLFADMPPERQAPGEGEVEIFANEDGKYVEIEVQGPHDEIAPGAVSDFTVRTLVTPAPSGARVGSEELVARVRQLAEELSGS